MLQIQHQKSSIHKLNNNRIGKKLRDKEEEIRKEEELEKKRECENKRREYFDY